MIQSFLKNWDRTCCSWGESCLGFSEEKLSQVSGDTRQPKPARSEWSFASSSGFQHRALLAQTGWDGGHHPTTLVWIQHPVVPVCFPARERMSEGKGFIWNQVFSAHHGHNDFSRCFELVLCFSGSAAFTVQPTVCCGIWGVVWLLVLLQELLQSWWCIGWPPGPKEKTVLNSKRSKHSWEVFETLFFTLQPCFSTASASSVTFQHWNCRCFHWTSFPFLQDILNPQTNYLRPLGNFTYHILTVFLWWSLCTLRAFFQIIVFKP